MEFSQLILNKLNAIDNRIAKIIVEEHENINGSFDYINIGSRLDLVSFLPDNKDPDDVWSELRNEIKIGRFAKTIIDIVNDDLDDEDKIILTDAEVEDFVNKYKVVSSGNYEFKIVEGEDIRKWYSEDMYVESGSGSLHDSCMKGDDEQSYLDIYTKNPNIRLLTLINSDNQLMGRAILWNLDSSPSPSPLFMDRIYVSEEYLFELFKQKAESEGWMYKVAQSNDLERGQEFLHLGKKYTGTAVVKLNRYTFDQYPYIDSMPFFNPKFGVLQSNGFKMAKMLRSVDGEGHNSCDCCRGEFEFDCNYCTDGNRTKCRICEGTGKQKCGQCNFTPKETENAG